MMIHGDLADWEVVLEALALVMMLLISAMPRVMLHRLDVMTDAMIEEMIEEIETGLVIVVIETETEIDESTETATETATDAAAAPVGAVVTPSVQEGPVASDSIPAPVTH